MMYDRNFVEKLPKAELHVHIEGTLEPEQMLLFAERNHIKLPYKSAEEIRKTRKFSNIQQFLHVYNASSVLQKEQDYYELMSAYLERAATQQVVHAEIFFDLQSHIVRGISPHTVINGFRNSMHAAYKNLGITSFLILCFLRDFSEEDAFNVFEYISNYRDIIIGIGLASDAVGNPPSKFKQVFAHARSSGYHTVAHAGEQDGPDAIWQALELLHAERIDHGVRCIEDSTLVNFLVDHRIPLTMCPLSNQALGFFAIQDNPFMKLFNAGLITTINSDDPAYFGGYIAENYAAVAETFKASEQDLITCARYSLDASFLPDSTKKVYKQQLLDYVSNYHKRTD